MGFVKSLKEWKMTRITLKPFLLDIISIELERERKQPAINIKNPEYLASPGAIIQIKCMATIDGARWLCGDTLNSSSRVSLVETSDIAGTLWKVSELQDSMYAFQNIGIPEQKQWLDGNTTTQPYGKVTLVSGTRTQYSGTQWKVFEVDEGLYSFKCIGDIEGPRWLDGSLYDNSVSLVPEVSSRYSGAKWEVYKVG